MRHRNAGFKLGRNTSHRRALLRNLTTSVIEEDRVETTVAKAKAVRPHVEKMITLGKKGDLHSRRQAHAFLRTDDAVKRLFDTVAPRYGDRQGGYLRIVRTGFQQGDGAEKAFIELLGAEKQLEVKRQKRADLKAKKRAELEKQLEEQKKEAEENPRRRRGRVSSGSSVSFTDPTKYHAGISLSGMCPRLFSGNVKDTRYRANATIATCSISDVPKLPANGSATLSAHSSLFF